MWPAITLTPGDTESGLAQSPLRLCHGWAHILPVSLRTWQKTWSSPPPHVGKAAWPWQGKAGMLSHHQGLGNSELPLRPAEKYSVVIPSFHEQGNHWKQFPKPALSCDSGLCPHCARCHTRLARGPGTALRAFPKCPKRAAGAATTGKQVYGETPAQAEAQWGLDSMSQCLSQQGEHRRGAACHGFGNSFQKATRIMIF